MSIRAAFAIAFGLVALVAPAHAQEADHEHDPVIGSSYALDRVYTPSPENFTLELRVGAYQPNLGTAANVFNGDLGPQLGVEYDVHLFRIPYLGPLAIGGSFAWAEWTGPATNATTGANVGQTGLSMVNLNLLAVLRIDVLARELEFPLVISPKVGLDVGYWQTGQEGVTRAEGWSVGLRWAVQAALELDFLEPRAARRLDDDWGINHSQIFFEMMGSTMGQWFDDQLPLGTDFAWVVGLGIVF